MRRYDATQPLISLHIPKTAGTSLKEVLGLWFPGDKLLFHYYRGVPLVSHNLCGRVCVHGHFNAFRGLGVKKYYQNVGQFIAFFREPFDRFVSSWNFRHKLKESGEHMPEFDGDPSFETYIRQCADENRCGPFEISSLWHMPALPGTVPIRRQFEDDFVFVGIVEEMAESVAALAVVLGKGAEKVPHLNAKQGREPAYEEWRTYYERHFSDEYELYEEARKQFGQMRV